MIPETYDCKVVLFKKGERGKTSHKSINMDSFISTMQKPEIQDRLHNGLLLGLLTHDGRSRARQGTIPHHDWVMKDPDLANVLREVTISDDTAYGYLDFTDTPAADRVKSLYKQGSRIGVSISVELIEEPQEFNIVELMGVDFTLRPEFPSTQIIEANFSEQDECVTNFNPIQIGNIAIGEGETVITKNFSEGDFSLREKLREHDRSPAINLKTRINEVIQWIKVSRKETFDKNVSYLRRYLLEYVNEWIMLALDQGTDLNLGVGLRLTNYCQDRRPMRDLQRYLRQAKSTLSTSGYMNRDVQLKLNQSFAETMNQIYEYINSKVNVEGKRL